MSLLQKRPVIVKGKIVERERERLGEVHILSLSLVLILERYGVATISRLLKIIGLF